MNPMTRREALRITVMFGAGVALGLPRWVRAGDIAAEGWHLIVFGDWAYGNGSPDQARVASALTRYVQTAGIHPEAVILLGDNFYGTLTGSDDPRWEKEFEQMYNPAVLPCPFYALLGNHDYEKPKGKELFELAYAQTKPGTRWRMPSKWYQVELPEKNPQVRFVALDSNADVLTAEEKAAQNSWLRGQLGKPSSLPWTFALGHHPIYSCGPHGDTKALQEDWLPLLTQHRADFYLCGHEHNFQHLEIENSPTSFVIAGGGGASLTQAKRHDRGPYTESKFGFLHLQISGEKVVTRMIDDTGRQIYGFEKTKAGKVMPLA